jgi:ectoine hydroxylase-related dioxygenase (phytanoyl-CoA dioxygenase family)
LYNVTFETVNQQLNEKGYYIFEERLNDATIEKLLDFAKSHKSSTRVMTDGKKSAVDLFYDPLDKKAVRYDYKENDLINNDIVQTLMCDPSIIHVAQNYLETTPIVDVVGMWWNTDFQKEPDSEAAQYFHFDMDRIKWLKFFFYLTDVDEEKGPHSFVEGSHRDGGIPFSMTSKGYARLSDEEVSKYYGKDKIKVFTAPKGTIIAEDTRGLHKGTNVINGDRLLFQIQFSNSLFGTQYQKSTIQFEGNDALKAFDQENPRILMNYK